MRIRALDKGDPLLEQVEQLVDGTFGYYSAPYWRWKHADPQGPPGTVIGAVRDGEVIGCNHFLQFDVRLGWHDSVVGAVTGDAVVRKQDRGRKLANDVGVGGYSDRVERLPDVAVIIAFTGQLGPRFQKVAGISEVGNHVQRWTKRFSWDAALDRLAHVNEKLVERNPRLAGVNHTARLEAPGSAPLVLRIDERGFTPTSVSAGADVTIRVHASLMSSSKLGMVFRIGRALATGKLRVSGSPRALKEVASVAPAYVRAFAVLRGA